MNAMLSVSPEQVMGLWEDLMDASNGCNGYGGDTAEIYLYRFMGHNPIVMHDRMQGGLLTEMAADAYRAAAATLHALCRTFEERRDVQVSLLGGELDDLLGPQVFDHRVHLVVSQIQTCDRG